ncbi:MAG TPA: flagellar motor protein MotD, partial [Xanthomonadaceae bacterium]|nr:flagellar motor protein MotD [Xanthomonadaceae bacterium]
ATAQFPSNWELSAARAASVVHVLLKAGLEPGRLAIGGMGQFHPVADNTTVEGRNANRRVVLVVLAGAGEDGTPIEKVLDASAAASPAADATQLAEASTEPWPGVPVALPAALTTDSPTARLAP